MAKVVASMVQAAPVLWAAVVVDNWLGIAVVVVVREPLPLLSTQLGN